MATAEDAIRASFAVAFFQSSTETSGARQIPFRRPSGGVAEGDEPHGCGERRNGPGMAHVRRPPEQRRREGS